ncbi:hypothetical protein JMG10_02715 [Nostoc ellipsosporum NOK]|nr:hypothetical protein [Nostoc ellipsosporum NOK]
MRKLFLVVLVLVCCIIRTGAQPVSDTADFKNQPTYQLVDIQENVSLIKLLANPEKYHGKRIQVIGYLHLEFEGDAIYLHQEDYTTAIMENAIWVNLSDKQRNNAIAQKSPDHYVILIGTFNAYQKGHLSMFGGSFDHITRLDRWK